MTPRAGVSAAAGLLVAIVELGTGGSWLAAAWAAVLGAATPWYRPAPRAALAAAALATGAIVVQASGIGPRVDVGQGFALLALPAVSAFFIAREVDTAVAVVAIAALMAATLFAGLSVSTDSLVPIVMPISMTGIAGYAVRSRDLVARQLADRAAELEAERETYAELSVRYERARIAAELHDIVAHAISLMVVQASAGQRLAEADPDAAAAAFRHIGDAARQAEADMERLIVLLADEREDGAPPDLELVAELVRRAQGSGLAVTLELRGERSGYPVEVARSAYLVVREGLTNALRYAAGARVAVLVVGEPGALRVEVRNARPAGGAVHTDLGAGTGLAGLRERLGRIGGRLDAGPDHDGGWVLTAQLPRRASAVH